MREFLKCLIPKDLEKRLRKILKRPLFHQNINYDPSRMQKKALISYLTFPLENPLEYITHTALLESLIILKTFIELDYSVDVAYCKDYTNLDLILRKHYDLVFGFGDPFLHYAKTHPNVFRIIYLTESSPDFSTAREKEREDYFYERHRKKMLIKRTNMYLTNDQIQIADKGILIGNDHTRATYGDLAKKIVTLYPTALENRDFVFQPKDHSKTRKNFLWFGSTGAIHKGLDLLFDVFTENPDIELFVCGLNGPEKKLFPFKKYRNIHDMGFVNVNSKKFTQLVNTCSFVVLPSCSEGVATSVLTCMYHGLIPVVTEETGIEKQDFVIIIPDYHLENVSEIIKYCSNMNPKKLAMMSESVFQYARKNFSLEAFRKNFKSVLHKCLNDQN